MRPIEDFMDESQKTYPNNLLHVFGVTLDDFGIKPDDYFRDRKVNFVFALKHKNNGKINSYKWMIHGIA
jgi:chitin synthase